jgi:hypothetical protein
VKRNRLASGLCSPHFERMAEKDDPPKPPAPPADPRQARLAAALRANLRRRKAPRSSQESDEV